MNRSDDPTLPTQFFPKLVAEFPDMPVESLPDIPVGWEDMSWQNEACPSFLAYRHRDASYIRVFVDYPDEADRRLNDKRFTGAWFDADGNTVGDGRPFVVTDDWATVLAAVIDEIRKCPHAPAVDSPPEEPPQLSLPAPRYPTLAAEFPNYPIESLPAIPEGWEDTSWHNDMYPTFSAYTRTDDAFIRVLIDHPEPAQRAMGGPRYLACWFDGTGAQFQEDFLIVETEEWSALLAAVAAEIAKSSLEGLGFLLYHTGGGNMAHARSFGSYQVRVTSSTGGLPVSAANEILIGLYDEREQIGKRVCPNMEAAREFLSDLAVFVDRENGRADQIPWDGVE